MWFQSGATWTIWCDVPLDLMDLRVIYGIKITSSRPNMLIEVRAEWAEWIEGSYMSQESQVEDQTS